MRSEDQAGLELARRRVEAGVEDPRVGAARAEGERLLGLQQRHCGAAPSQGERDRRTHDPSSDHTHLRALQERHRTPSGVGLVACRHVLDRLGLADQESLRVVDAELAQQVQRGLVLDTLGDRLDAEVLGHGDDRLHDLLIGGIDREVPDELDVDLDEGDRQVLQVGERAVAGAEVVEREAAAETTQAPGEVARGPRRRAA